MSAGFIEPADIFVFMDFFNVESAFYAFLYPFMIV